MKPLSDEWTSYSGDLTGKRYSALKHVNKDTVKNLSLKWITPLNQGCGPTGRESPAPRAALAREVAAAAVVAAPRRRATPSSSAVSATAMRTRAGRPASAAGS